MSIAADAGVMDAKLKGNIPMLQQMAAQGSMSALAALKELIDGQNYAKSLAQNAQIQTPEMAPVLQQLMGKSQAPQTFADGGSVGEEDSDGYLPGESIWERAMRRAKSGLTAVGQTLNKSPGTPGAYDPGTPRAPVPASLLDPNYGHEGRGKPVVGTSPVGAKRPTAPSGIAAIAGPEDDEPVRVSPGRSPTGPTSTPAPAAAAADSPADFLEKYLASQKGFADERSGLTAASRAQAQAALERGQKQANSGSGIMGLLRNVAASPSSRALTSLSQGAVKTYDEKQARGEKLNALQDAFDKHDMLLQQADLAARQGDVATEYKLRTAAAELARKMKLDESTVRMNDSHAGYYEGMEKRAEAEAKFADRNKGKTGGSGGAGGIKPMNPIALEGRIQAAARAMLAADKEAGKMDINHVPLTEEEAYNKASARVRSSVGAPGGATIPSNAVPSATGWGKATIK